MKVKNATNVDRSKFAENIDLATLKSNVYGSDNDKLKNVSTNYAI